MAKKMYGSLELRTQSSIIFTDADSSNSVSVRSPATVSSNLTLTLPASVTANGVLKTDGSGNLTSALISNANVDAAAAIAYSKLNLTGSIVDADINATAGIALTKLATMTADRALISDASGYITDSAVTATELSYVSGVTSSIQSQLGGKASTALSNLTVASLAAESLLVGTSSSAVKALGVGSEGQVLKVVSGAVAWAADAAGASFKDDWETADTATFAVTHGLGTKDIMVEIYDKATDETIEIDSVVRTSTNVVTLTASEAPGASGWRVLITAV